MRLIIALILSAIWGASMGLLVKGIPGILLSFVGAYGIAYILSPSNKTVEAITEKKEE